MREQPDWAKYEVGVDPELDKICAREFGSAHKKPCKWPHIITCRNWDCQVSNQCKDWNLKADTQE